MNAEQSNLYRFFCTRFTVEVARRLFAGYKVGGIGPESLGGGMKSHWVGASVFWQTDIAGKVRSGKIIQYDPANGRRGKYTTWAHSVLISARIMEDFQLMKCPFGEHLVSMRPNVEVSIVESEKTAMICGAYYPGKAWIAVGGAGNLNTRFLARIPGRAIAAYPDAGCYQKWAEAAEEMKSFFGKVRVDGWLEDHAQGDPNLKGADLADIFPVLESGLFRCLQSDQPVYKSFPGKRAVEAVAVPKLEPVEIPESLPVLAQMIENNPALQELINRFDLHETQKTA